jgi:hypothetical protein
MMANVKGTVTVRVEDQEVKSALRKAAAGVRPMCRSELDGIGKRLRADMRSRLTRHGKVDTRRLWSACEYEVQGRGASLRVEVGPRVGDPGVEPYDVVIEGGRRPGAKMPPSDVLIPWMQRHGIPEEAEFPIRRAIGAKGLQSQPFPYLEISKDRSAYALKAADRVLTFVRDVMD